MFEILDKAKNLNVIVLGDVMLDRYWWGDVTRISPEAPVPVVRLKRSTEALGGAANVAANIAGLGGLPLLVGGVGPDEAASAFPRLCIEMGISGEHLVTLPGRSTTVKTRIIAHSQQVARVDQETSQPLNEQQENAIVGVVEALLPRASAVAISDYAKGLLTPKVISSVISSARRAGVPVLVDPKGRDYSKYQGASLITPNRREAAEACNIDDNGKPVVDLAGNRLLADWDFGSVLITEGEEGMTLFTKGGKPIHMHATAREVYDVTGAGDTVIAAMTLAVASGAPLTRAAELANAAAGLAVEKVGTTVVTADMIRGLRDTVELHAAK